MILASLSNDKGWQRYSLVLQIDYGVMEPSYSVLTVSRSGDCTGSAQPPSEDTFHLKIYLKQENIIFKNVLPVAYPPNQIKSNHMCETGAIPDGEYILKLL